MKKQKRHAHKISQVPYMAQQRQLESSKRLMEKDLLLEELYTTPIGHLKSEEANCMGPVEKENEENLSFQQTAPRIEFPSPLSSFIKRSYLDQSNREHLPTAINLGSEIDDLEEEDNLQSFPCSKRCTLVANDGGAEFYRHIAHPSEDPHYGKNCGGSKDYPLQITEPTEDDAPSRRKLSQKTGFEIRNHDRERLLELEGENKKLRERNQEIDSKLHQIESRYAKISQLLDKVPLPDIIQKEVDLNNSLEDSRRVLAGENKLRERTTEGRNGVQNKFTIDSLDSLGTFVDENEISSKDYFANGIIQLVKSKPVKNLSVVSSRSQEKSFQASPLQTQQIMTLSRQLSEKEKEVEECKLCLREVMAKLKELEKEAENRVCNRESSPCCSSISN